MPAMEDTLKPSIHRPIRSFVLRQGRLTQAQKRALEVHSPVFELPPSGPWQSPWPEDRPLFLEIGFGNGEHLAAFAAAHPDWGCIGAEVHAPGVGALLLRLQAQALDNVRVVHGDVTPWLQTLPGKLFSLVVIQFPDPWPKKKHRKRRLFQEPFLTQLERVLVPGAELQLATDWEDYAWQMLEVLQKSPHWVNLATPGPFAAKPPNRIPTRFERRGQALGHGVYDLRFAYTPQ